MEIVAGTSSKSKSVCHPGFSKAGCSAGERSGCSAPSASFGFQFGVLVRVLNSLPPYMPPFRRGAAAFASGSGRSPVVPNAPSTLVTVSTAGDSCAITRSGEKRSRSSASTFAQRRSLNGRMRSRRSPVP